MADNRTMEELLQAATEGYGEAIVISEINADHFEIKTNLLQLVQANPYHGFERENPHTHINNFKRITSTLKFRDVPNDVIKLMMFPYSLEGSARFWYDKEPPNSIFTWEDLVNKFVNQFFPPLKTTHLKNEISRFTQRFEETFGEAWERFKEMLRACPHYGFTKLTKIDTFYNGLNENDQDSLNAVAGGNLLTSTSGTLLCNTIPNPKGEIKAITTRSGVAYEGPLILTNPSPKKVVKRETEETTNKEQTNFQRSAAHIQPSVTPIPKLDVPKTLPKPNIPYPSRFNDQKLREKATNQMEKFFQIFQDLHFNISFADALLLMPKFSSTIKSFLANKDKLFELAKIPLNENCSVILLKKLPEKLGNPDKFLIPCNFSRMDVCHALADLGASLNLMPLSIWKNLSLPELTPTRMTLELANRSITRPKGVAKDVFVKVGKFHFPTDFVVVDFEADPCVPLILGRFFLRISRANPTSTSEPIISDSSPSLTPFEGKEDICLIEKLLNDDPFQLPPMDLKQEEVIKAKYLIEEPLELELKDLPSHLEYAYLEGADKLLVIITKDLKDDEKEALLKEDYKPAVQSQRRVNSKIHEVIKKEVIKLLDAEMIYLISDSSWVSPIYCVPKKGGITVVENENNELIPTRLVTGCRVCIDYQKLNDATRKDHFPLLFMDQMLERLAGNEFYCFLDRFFSHFQIPNNPPDREKTTFTYPYGTFAYRRMPFGICNAPGTFQRCMMAIFHDIIEKTMEVFMDDILVFGDSFSSCLSYLDTMLQRLIELNFDVIAKLPYPTTVKGVRSFLGHAGFYRQFIQDFSKIPRHMTYLLEKETPFVFSKYCIDAFETLKKKLTEAPILVVLDWNLPFELMCDASDFTIGAILGQHKTKHFQPIHCASKTMTTDQIHYTTTKKEMFTVVYAFEKFRPYLVLSKSIVSTDHSDLKYLLNHLSRLENPHKDVFKNKDINENFPLETLGKISSGSTPWFSDFANFHAGNFIVKEMSSQQKKKFFKDIKNYFGYILVAVDYLSKWVEAKALPTNDARDVVKFLKSLFTRFGTPRAIISDRRTYFCNDKFAKVMSKYGVTHRLATAYHPQTRLLTRHPLLVYGKSCHLPIELEHKAYWALKHATFDLKTTGDHRKLQLNELNKLRDQAYENSLIYKEKTKKLHDSKIKNRIFNVGPFIITQVFPYGTIELSQPEGLNFKVNGQRVKHYFGWDKP
nr:hypothetical protein [Tanacetum cinerariifolium]